MSDVSIDPKNPIKKGPFSSRERILCSKKLRKMRASNASPIIKRKLRACHPKAKRCLKYDANSSAYNKYFQILIGLMSQKFNTNVENFAVKSSNNELKLIKNGAAISKLMMYNQNGVEYKLIDLFRNNDIEVNFNWIPIIENVVITNKNGSPELLKATKTSSCGSYSSGYGSQAEDADESEANTESDVNWNDFDPKVCSSPKTIKDSTSYASCISFDTLDVEEYACNETDNPN